MNRLTTFVAVFVACTPVAIVACSGSTPNASGPQDGGADTGQPACATSSCAPEGGSSGQDATVDSGFEIDSTVGDTGTSIDSGPDSPSVGDASSDAPMGDSARDSAVDSGGDAGTTDDGAIPQGGLQPTPGQVACGTTTCAVPATECCIASSGTGSCADAGSACGLNTATIQCNETSDCPTSQVCCFAITADGGVEVTAACQAAPCATAQACRTHAECVGDSGPCTIQQCGDSTYELCGLPFFLGTQCTPE